MLKSVKRKKYVFGFGIVVLTFAVFYQVTRFQFVHFDDGFYVVNNARLWDGFSWDDVSWSFSTTYFSNWHPLVWLSYMADAWGYGRNSGGFHLTNVIIHAANAVLLFTFLTRATGAVGRSAFVAAVFAVHPLHVESVAWISSRKDVLSTLFGVISLICYSEYARSLRPRWYLAALTTFVCSLMSKQMLVTLPFVMLLLDVWPLRRLRYGPDLDNTDSQTTKTSGTTADTSGGGDAIISRDWKFLIFEKLPYFAIALVMILVAYRSQQTGGGTEMMTDLSLSIRCLNSVLVYALYLLQTIWPWNLAVFYPHPGGGLSMLSVAFAAAAILGLSLAAKNLFRRHPYVLVGWLWFLGTLVPVIGLVQIGRQQMADRYMYFPMIGILIGVAWFLTEFPRNRLWKEVLLPKLACVVLVVLAIAGWLQTGYWRDSETLFVRAIAVTENNSVMHFNLGRTFQEKRQSNDAIKHYRRAVEIDPNYAKAHSAWGIALAEQQIFTPAKTHFERALELEPRMVEAHTALGNIELAFNRFEIAIMHFRDAIEIKPQHANAHYNLGLALHEQRNYREALAEFELAARLAPGNRQFIEKFVGELNFVGEFLLDQDQSSEAAVHFRKALKLHPGFKRAQANLKKAERD